MQQANHWMSNRKQALSNIRLWALGVIPISKRALPWTPLLSFPNQLSFALNLHTLAWPIPSLSYGLARLSPGGRGSSAQRYKKHSSLTSSLQTQVDSTVS